MTGGRTPARPAHGEDTARSRVQGSPWLSWPPGKAPRPARRADGGSSAARSPDGSSLPRAAPRRRAKPRSFRDPRVELEVEKVGHEIEEDHRQRQHEKRSLQHRVVALQHRLVDGAADPRPREHNLDQDGAGNDVTERKCDERGDRQQRVSQRVRSDDRPWLQPLRARGEDVVLAERLEHRRAYDQRVLAVQHEPERQRRQEDVRREIPHVRPERRVEQELVRHPAGRQDPGEDDDQHQPEPLRGHCVEAERTEDGQALGLRPAPPRRDDPGERAEDDREHGAERDHRQRVDQGDAEVRGDGLLVLVRDAEVSVRELLEVDDVLLPLRLVEAELHLERVPQLLRRVRDAREVRDGSAGREAEEDEVDRHRHEDGDDRESDALQDVVGPLHEKAYFWCTCVRPWMFSSLKGPCGGFWKSAQLEETAATESSFASQRYGRWSDSIACIFQTIWRRFASVGATCCSVYILSYVLLQYPESLQPPYCAH